MITYPGEYHDAVDGYETKSEQTLALIAKGRLMPPLPERVR